MYGTRPCTMLPSQQINAPCPSGAGVPFRHAL
jgi:hypothetical protein